jgi:hypothetical protein
LKLDLALGIGGLPKVIGLYIIRCLSTMFVQSYILWIVIKVYAFYSFAVSVAFGTC